MFGLSLLSFFPAHRCFCLVLVMFILMGVNAVLQALPTIVPSSSEYDYFGLEAGTSSEMEDYII